MRNNRFRYRGYYYDIETGFYYLNSRYYDPGTGRFVNADGLLVESILGCNLYSYCFNNPISMIDHSGNWAEAFWEGVKSALSALWNPIDAFFNSIEAEAGLGTGIDINIFGLGAGVSNDTFIGFDDGETTTGHQANITIILASTTGKHYAEKGNNRLMCPYCGWDYGYKTAFDYLECPHTERSDSVTLGPFSYDTKGDFVISGGVSAHLIFGGYINVGFNVTEFLERLFD